MSKKYNENSTQHIDAREFTRKRPSTYCGSTEYSTQLLKELFANAHDEHIIGHGTEIVITVDTKKNEYTCEDFAQGFIPGVERPDGETMLSECFSVINTSGKYDDSDDSIYGGSALGLNGIGMKLVCYLSSSSMITTSDGKGQRETLWYKDGLFQKREITKEKTGIHGTKVTYIPDPQFFQNPEANLNDIRTLFKEESALSPTLTIKLIVDGKEEDFHSKNGINDLVDEKVKEDEIIKKRFNAHIVKGNDLIDICMTYTSGYSEDIVSYVNYGKVESGIHLTTLRANLTRALNKYANDNKLYKKDETNLTGAELNEGLIIVFNLKAKSVKYDSQTKVRVTDIDKALILEAINVNFVEWMNENPKDVKTIIEKALLARRARNAAKKAREVARATKGNKKSKLANLPSKLVDCSTENRLEAELHICEGDSAASGLVGARIAEYQAIFPIRGKMINSFKNKNEKVMANQEVNNLIKALGLELNDKGKLIYDKSKLRYGKIIADTDGDPDGQNIRMLIAVNLWSLCPELIINGHFYVAYAPLFRITTNKNEYIYIKDAQALEDYKKKHIGEKYRVNRMKGLGECDADELSDVLLDPKTRNVKQLVVEDAIKAEKHLEMLMGTSVTGRRQFLLANGNKANDLWESEE